MSGIMYFADEASRFSQKPETHSPEGIKAGKDNTNAITCNMAMRFAGSSSPDEISCLLKTLLMETPRLDAMADQNPDHVNETSVREATPTPAATTSKLRMTCNDGSSCSMTRMMAAVKSGSEAFRVWAKATSTSAREMLAKSSPSQCSKANGIILASRDMVTLEGRCCNFKTQATMQHAEQVPKFTVVMRTGHVCVVSNRLFSTLYAMFVPYRAATHNAPSMGEGRVGDILSICGAALNRCFWYDTMYAITANAKITTKSRLKVAGLGGHPMKIPCFSSSMSSFSRSCSRCASENALQDEISPLSKHLQKSQATT
mmetsp:Transcript_60923/g.137375  ORF Transcript_60923/g.137375 Transcript_60923/m.137375 type:complete len:315 (+) Transcript_60923:375-1319(+)